MKKNHLVLFLLLACTSFLIAQEQVTYFADDPCLTPDGKTLIFSYEGDLWQSPVEGGVARRITAMEGQERYPRVSPDGKWLAFSGEQYGNADVFIMPLNGGAIQQLTFHEAGDQVEQWSWDSKTIYFNSSRYNRISTYKVAMDGGTPKRLFGHYFNNIHNVMEHPSSGEIFFNETWESSSFVHRQRYKGAYNPDIKSYNPKTGAYKQYTDYEGKDMSVTIDRNGNSYFLSDEHRDVYNLYELDGENKKRLTNFDTPAFAPFVSADGSSVVFRRDYQIWRYDTKTKKSAAIPIRIVRNQTLAREQDFKVQGNVTDFDVAPDGKKMAFVSRGEVFVSDIKGQFIRQIQTAPDGRVSEVYWLKDNKSLLFNQTVAGYQNWFTIAADGSGKATQLTDDGANNRLLTMNSDRTKAAYLSGRSEVRLLDLESKESKVLARAELWGFQNDRPYFGPDDRHVVFTAYQDFERDMYVVDIESGAVTNLTQTGVSEVNPYWSPDGKYLYFLTNRTQPNYPRGMGDAKIYRMPLEKYDEPFRQEKFDELFADKKEEKKDSTEDKKKEETEKITVSIDEDGLMERLERMGPRFGSQRNIYVYQKDGKTTLLYTSNHNEGRYGIWKTEVEPFEDTKTEEIKGARTGSFEVREVKGKHYVLFGGNIYTLNLGQNKVDKIDINHTFRRELRAEFDQMFTETWANMEENFYNETFHGIDWAATRDRYEPYLPFVNNRADLRRLLNDMLGELNTSHFGFYSSGKEEEAFYGTRTLAAGLLFEEDKPYQVATIITDGPADRKGKDIKKGDVLVAVNGQRIDAAKNREAYFAQPSLDQELVLTFQRGGEEHQVMLHPISAGAQRNLLYDEWMDERQAIVDKATDKQVAYVHMKNMGGGELESFLEQMVSEWHQRDALILDLRYNTGGNVHDAVLQFLSQRPYLKWKYREGKLSNQPNFAPAGKPIVVLINEQSLSDAEMTTAGFKELGLGTVIGTETYRWIIFTSGKGLVDGSFYRLPSWGCYTLDGKNLEKTGVSPDIFVKNTFKDRLDQKDPQLDRAISEILKQMKNDREVGSGK
ncbi:S41 family peptidase [Flavilitoribacter nigricans]|uniref:Tricorn protease homolog n=1 Tax=Flavilitoribacter nigricans (strain ATCC 23147 / DSM 23189 / NBRC 102662 / NCIMB 1420 / SS-2) TaxID=1122177 RepID=A0A2D0N6W5_FLAN2|nr:S41 family peptidase [Flavilitoribacter nigricans]PHN04207.1 peptidase S41 [Flavilitoribacter nigricans DSM 23189 = NBRC 102662]